MDWIYLDNNATSRPAPEVVEAMREMLDAQWANPSSVHRFGQLARRRLEQARTSVAQLIHCKDRELVFTSGGTEANNLALNGVLSTALYGANSDAAPLLITTPVEHAAVREPAQSLGKCGVNVVMAPVGVDGRVSANDLSAALDQHASTEAPTLVSIQWANNETGVIQPMAALVEAVDAFRRANPKLSVLFHSDATQAAGKIPVDVQAIGVDLMTFSAHKFHGPKGAGALYIRRGVRFPAQQIGGPQERERRGGTENTTGAVGMGVAADLARAFLANEKTVEALRQKRDHLERAMVEVLPDTAVNGAVQATTPRLSNTSNLGFPRLEAEAILLALSERGVCASAGAACSSGSLEPSPVLLAMGVAEPIAHGSVRFSLSRYTTDQEIDQAIEIIPQVIHRLAKTLPAKSTA